MNKLLSILIAGFFATGVFAQAVTTTPGGAMGPTDKTEAAKGGAAKSSGTAVKGDKSKTPAVTTAPGGAMGPTEATAAAKGGPAASSTKKTYEKAKDGTTAVTTDPGGAMGPTKSK